MSLDRLCPQAVRRRAGGGRVVFWLQASNSIPIRRATVRPWTRSTPYKEGIALDRGEDQHVPPFVTHCLPTTKQALASEASSLGGADGCGIPRFDIQFQTRDVKRRECPVPDGTQRMPGYLSSPRRRSDPVADRRPPKVDVPEPESDCPDPSVAFGLGDDERVSLA